MDHNSKQANLFEINKVRSLPLEDEIKQSYLNYAMSVIVILRPPRLARLRRGAVGRVPARRAHCFSGQQWLPFWLFAQPGAPGDRPHKAASGA